MKLITKNLEKILPSFDKELGNDPTVKCHFFNPAGRGDWFGISYDRDNRIMFGYVSLFGDHNDELGDFSIHELENLELPFGMKIERDRYWNPKPLSVVKEDYTNV